MCESRRTETTKPSSTMSSSILNKRIIVDLTAEVQPSKCSDDGPSDSLPPVKKPFLASNPNAVNEEILSDDESIHAASLIESDSECVTTESAIVQNEINDDDHEGKRCKSKSMRLWMKVGSAKREPRVGSDFQAMIE